MDINERLEEITPESISEKEREMLDVFNKLDKVGKISAIHSLYSIICNELLLQAKAEKDLEKNVEGD